MTEEEINNLIGLFEDDSNEVIIRYRTGDRTKEELGLTGHEVEAIIAALVHMHS